MKNAFFLTALVCCILVPLRLLAAEGCLQKLCTPDELIQIFDKGVQLNEQFKASVSGADRAKYAELSEKVDLYFKEKIQPSNKQAGKILSRQANPKLAQAFLRVVVSYENFADEMLSDLLGTIFGKNPSVIEHAVKTFSAPDKKIILNLLQLGWGNVKADFDARTSHDRDMRLLQLSKT